MPVQLLSYEPVKPARAIYVKPAPDGAILVLPPYPLLATICRFLFVAGAAAFVLLTVGIEKSRWDEKIVIAVLLLLAYGWGTEVWMHLSGRPPPRRVLISATRKHMGPVAIAVRRGWPSFDLRPRWAVRITWGRSWWNRTSQLYTIGRHRAFAEMIAADVTYNLI